MNGKCKMYIKRKQGGEARDWSTVLGESKKAEHSTHGGWVIQFGYRCWFVGVWQLLLFPIDRSTIVLYCSFTKLVRVGMATDSYIILYTWQGASFKPFASKWQGIIGCWYFAIRVGGETSGTCIWWYAKNNSKEIHLWLCDTMEHGFGNFNQYQLLYTPIVWQCEITPRDSE
jgi:hypothetical protein